MLCGRHRLCEPRQHAYYRDQSRCRLASFRFWQQSREVAPPPFQRRLNFFFFPYIFISFMHSWINDDHKKSKRNQEKNEKDAGARVVFFMFSQTRPAGRTTTGTSNSSRVMG